MRLSKFIILSLFILTLIPVSPTVDTVKIPNSPATVVDGAVTHEWAVEFVLVNYDSEVIDVDTLLESLPTTRDFTNSKIHIHYDISYHVTFADASYAEAVKQAMLDNSINGSDTGTMLNESALVYQKAHLDEPQRIFYPRAGRAIDGDKMEQWFLDNPYVTPPQMGYTFYLLNYSMFDSSDHSLEHWFDYHPVDPDSGRPQDFFRLEWDNDLNPDVKFQFPGFGGKRGNIYVLDPSADNWYLKWARIWWDDPPYDGDPLCTFMDMDTLVESLDLSDPADADNLTSYIADYIYDPINYLFFPYLHDPIEYVSNGRLKSLIFCMDVDNGVSVDSLRWVTNAEMQREHLTQLIPFINWTVDVEYLDINDYPDWESLFWDYATVDNGVTVADGGPMFDAIYTNMRPNYITGASDTAEVFGVVFIKKNMVMQYAGRTFTGLGGGGQTVIWKSWERYYLSDGVTPKAGVSTIQLHETMHAIGFGHTWTTHHYAGDFSSSPMGYFSFHNGTSVYDQNWAQSTYLDQMIVQVSDDILVMKNTVDMDNSRVAEAYNRAMSLIDTGSELLDQMDWQGSYEALQQAEQWISRMQAADEDSTPPVIVDWGISGGSIRDDFVVWVDATDDRSGIYSVEVHLTAGFTSEVKNCVFNGSYWVADFDAIPPDVDPVIFRITVLDNGLNEAYQEFTITGSTIVTPPLIPPVTIIVGVSVAIVAAVVILYIRRRGSQ